MSKHRLRVNVGQFKGRILICKHSTPHWLRIFRRFICGITGEIVCNAKLFETPPWAVPLD